MWKRSQRIRLACLKKKESIKKAARDLGISRNTVRKVVRSGETSFSYERKVQPMPKLGPWIEELERRLEANEEKARRDRLSMVRIYEDIASLGYGGGYDAVRRYAKAWRRRQRSVSPAQAYVPLSFDPGEACQFDWSHEHVALGGVTTKVKAAHMRLCHSRMPVVQIYPREGQEMVFEAHERAFRFFGGVCRRGIYDNMKTAVNAVFVGKGRAYNHRFRQMCSHHLVEPVACTPGAGWEKGQVERQVDHVRGRLFVPRLRGRSYEEINAWLMDECIREAKRCPHPVFKDKTMWQVFEGERPFLMAYLGPFDGFHAVEAGVSKTCLVRFDNHHYSVDARAVGRLLDVRAYADRIVIRQDGETVAEQQRHGLLDVGDLLTVQAAARKGARLQGDDPLVHGRSPKLSDNSVHIAGSLSRTLLKSVARHAKVTSCQCLAGCPKDSLGKATLSECHCPAPHAAAGQTLAERVAGRNGHRSDRVSGQCSSSNMSSVRNQVKA